MRQPYRPRIDRPLPPGPFSPLPAPAGIAIIEHWRVTETPDGPYVLDGVALGRTIASVVIAINDRGTIARLAEGWFVLGCPYDANAELPDETEVIRRAAAWIRANRPS